MLDSEQEVEIDGVDPWKAAMQVRDATMVHQQNLRQHVPSYITQYVILLSVQIHGAAEQRIHTGHDDAKGCVFRLEFGILGIVFGGVLPRVA